VRSNYFAVSFFVLRRAHVFVCCSSDKCAVVCFFVFLSHYFDTFVLFSCFVCVEGIEVEPTNFPSSSSLMTLEYKSFISHLVKQHQYVEGTDLFVLSFDWRLGEQTLAARGYYEKVRVLIEQTFEKTQVRVFFFFSRECLFVVAWRCGGNVGGWGRWGGGGGGGGGGEKEQGE
jgi:hypothetical protein